VVDIEPHLNRLDEIDTDNRSALAELLASTAMFNADIQNSPPPIPPSTGEQAITGRDAVALSFGGDLATRLHEWLDKLIEKLQAIVEKFSGASFTVTIGAPFQVSVSVTFERKVAAVT
jgi:hypothetical protein